MKIPFLRVEYTDQKGPERFIISVTGIPNKEIFPVSKISKTSSNGFF